VDHQSASELLGPYALDACDQAETAAIEAHVRECATCQRDVAEIQEASGWLGVFETAIPAEWLRAAILREAATDAPGRIDRRAGVGDRRGNRAGDFRS
jgi:anti-sigma factor RsiW